MNPETDLTTLAAVKEALPVPAANVSNDATLQTLISACSADFLRATRRPDLLAADYTEVREGDGGHRLVLYHWPINSVATLTVGSVTVPASTDKIAPGYFFDLDIDPERAFNLYMIGQSFTDAVPVKIGYNAGYATVPDDIAQAVIDWVIFRYKQRPNLGTPQRKLSEGESLEQVQDDAPATAKAVIERYMRRIPSVSRRLDEEQARAAAASQRRAPRR